MWHDGSTLMCMTPRATDERLAWLAVRDYVNKRTRPSIFLRILGSAANLDNHYSSGRTPEPPREAQGLASAKAQSYAFAVDDAARELSHEELVMLRSTGHVPDWFIARVEQLYRANR